MLPNQALPIGSRTGRIPVHALREVDISTNRRTGETSAAAPRQETMILVKDHTAEELAARLSIPLRLARRLQGAVVKRGALELPRELPEVSPKLLARVRESATVPHLELVEKVVSAKDGFAKYLFRGAGEEPFETVRIPLLHKPADPKYVVCV